MNDPALEEAKETVRTLENLNDANSEIQSSAVSENNSCLVKFRKKGIFAKVSDRSFIFISQRTCN